MTMFPPNLQAARTRLDAIRPAHYANTRNALDGAVTLLSPYITHGMLTLPDAINAIKRRHPLKPADKLMMEFGWREFFHHVWQHLGDGILEDRGPAVSPVEYAQTLPDDIRQGATGVPVIDEAVRTLYATGYLHNHARMWLASYVVHLRKVHWRVGADWLYGHLIDGDLASNHLSWQWVAGTFSNKPYLFNAENVARYAPVATHAQWHSPGTAVDQDYEVLEALAKTTEQVGPEPGNHPACIEPALIELPPDCISSTLPALKRRVVELVHPWNLGEDTESNSADFRLGVIHLPFHHRFPWSAARWNFVLTRMRERCHGIFVGDIKDLTPHLVDSQTQTLATLNPGYAESLQELADEVRPDRKMFSEPEELCPSFSQFYAKVSGVSLTRKPPPKINTKFNTHKQGRRNGARR